MATQLIWTPNLKFAKIEAMVQNHSKQLKMVQKVSNGSECVEMVKDKKPSKIISNRNLFTFSLFVEFNNV